MMTTNELHKYIRAEIISAKKRKQANYKHKIPIAFTKMKMPV